MIINHNLGAMNAIRNMNINSSNASKSMQKLSSGLRINSAADDAAGLAISEKMKGQIRGLDQASANSQDAISLTQTAEGSLSETQSILQRMRELAVQSSNDTNTADDRTAIQTEMNQLTSEVNRIGNTTEFNTKKLLDGSISQQSGTVTAGTLTAGSTTLSNLSLDKKSSLKAGNYSIAVADTTTKSATDAADATVTNLDIDQNSKLAAGNYKINIQQSQVKGATLATAADSVTAVAINPLSTEADGTHAVAITRTDSVASGAFTGTNTGLTADGVSVTSSTAAGASGTYTIETAAKLSAVSNGTAAANNYITLNLDSADALGNASGYKLAYTEEDSVNHTYSVQLQDNTGAAVSEKVLLDNNVQHYDFKVAGSPATDLGISFDTAATVNAKLAAANAGAGESGNCNTFDVSTDLTLKQGATTVGTANVAAGAIAGNSTIGDFTIAHGAANTLINGKSDTFAVTNTLTATVDGADSHTFTAGDTINFADGMNVTTSSDITKYSAIAPESYNVTVGTTEAYTATVQTSAGAAVSGAQTVTVDATNGGSYNLGNGVDFTLGAGQLTGATSHNFTVADTTKTIATLINTTTNNNTTVATKTVNGAETIDFGSGLTVAVADKTNGNATFSITGSVEDDSLKMQIGANNGETMNIDVNDMRSLALGISSAASGATKQVTDSMGNSVNASYTTIKDVTNGTNNSNAEYALDVSTADKATAAISVLDSAISAVSTERSKLGAIQNRLEHTINNLGTASQNLTSAQSRIADVDMAKEMSEFSKNNILSQAAQAMLAQANQQPQQVLQLLR